MEKAALKDLLYGGLTELMNNKDFYYRSSVGPDYSYWTKQGIEVVLEYIKFMSGHMQVSEKNDLDRRAKDLVIKGLKGETV